MGLVILFIVFFVVFLGFLFCEICCFMFLIIMMVLLIMIFIDRIKLNSESVFSEKLNRCIKVKVLISEMGIVIRGIMDVCQVCRNSIMIRMISMRVFSNVIVIDCSDVCMKIVGLQVIWYLIFCGKFCCNLFILL